MEVKMEYVLFLSVRMFHLKNYLQILMKKGH
jgi:hypothetical protein